MASINYKKVREIKANDWNINIFGVVKFFRPPTKIQKTGQYQMTITVIDESVGQDVETGIRCNIFDSDAERLPQVKKVGDIILLKQVKVKMYCGRLQVQRTNTYEWIVFGTDKNSSGRHYIRVKTTSLTAPAVTHHDRQRVKELLEFLDTTESKIIESEMIRNEDGDDKITLSDFKINTYVDVVVQVVDVKESAAASAAATAVLLKVTDGTKVPFYSLYQTGRVQTKGTNELEQVTKEYACDISVFDDHVDDVKKLKVGDFIEITNLHVKAVSKELLEKWKDEMNIQGSDNLTEWREIIVHSGTSYNRGIRMLPNDDPCLTPLKERIAVLTNEYHATTIIENILKTIDQEENHNKENSGMAKSRCSDEHPDSLLQVINEQETQTKSSSGIAKRHCSDEPSGPSGTVNIDEPRCLQESLTTTDYPLKPVTSVLSLKRSHDGSNKFRLRAKVHCIKPNCFTDMIVGKCGKCNRVCKPCSKQCNDIPLQCPTCNDGVLTLTYFFRMLVEDETGLLEVVAGGDDAVYFFNGITPTVLVKETALMNNFEEKLRRFDSYEKENVDITRVPFIDVCISAREMSNMTKYWMFGTSMI